MYPATVGRSSQRLPIAAIIAAEGADHFHLRKDGVHFQAALAFFQSLQAGDGFAFTAKEHDFPRPGDPFEPSGEFRLCHFRADQRHL